MIRLSRPLASLALCAALAAGLAACQDKSGSPKADAAEGAKLLPRSVDDAMPAYDTKRSKAPLMEPEQQPSSGASPRARSATPSETPSASEEASPAPSESPSATPDAG